jgi:glucosamine--fructose-6-phosphate aminotransferase (isomerizing)
MRRLKSAGIKTLVITNVPGSTASRLGEVTVYSKAGAEVSVAATKSFVAQLCALYQLALSHPAVDPKLRETLITELLKLPADIEKVFDSELKIMDCARYVSNYENAFFIGRGVNYPVALEGALKLKEISYIHAEGYAAGEMKHGPFALLYPGVPIIALMCQDENYDSMVTSIKEVKARNAYVIAVADENDTRIDGLADAVIRVPHTHYLLSPVVNTVALQLLSYYAANVRGCPIDFPRNLAKSVTVE